MLPSAQVTPAALIASSAVKDHQVVLEETALRTFQAVCNRDGHPRPSTTSDALLVSGVWFGDAVQNHEGLKTSFEAERDALRASYES